MNRLGGVDRITVHHDGMPPIRIANRMDVARRIDSIRQAHQNAGWGDIGYHFIVDPFGQVWEGRRLFFQGAHVHDHNVRNLGVLTLGNFEIQTPTRPQQLALSRFVAQRMRQYRVPLDRVYTHRELTPTLCPGRNLQRVMNQLRSSAGALAQA